MYGTKSISNTDNIVDSRDVIKRISELESDRDDLQSAITDAEKEIANHVPDEDEETNLQQVDDLQTALTTAMQELEDWKTDSDGEELKDLLALQSEGESSPDWYHGETLMHEDYFETYARQLAEDIGAISGEEKWPLTCIDWKEAAEELQQDYTSLDFGGETYYIPS